MDWKLSAELQEKLDSVTALNARLQAEMGIKSLTIAERAEEYKRKKAQQLELTKSIGVRRPPPKWKI